MALSINAVREYNGKSFLGNSSAKPIAGVIVRKLHNFGISQGKLSLSGSDAVCAGEPVKITSSSTASNAGRGLNPNVLSVTKSNGTSVQGFLAVNQTDVLDFGDEAPYARDTQIVDLGVIGSGTEMYLAVAADVAGLAVGAEVEWDDTQKVLKKKSSGTALKVQIISNVVDGVKIKKDESSNIVGYEECKVAKVRL